MVEKLRATEGGVGGGSPVENHQWKESDSDGTSCGDDMRRICRGGNGKGGLQICGSRGGGDVDGGDGGTATPRGLDAATFKFIIIISSRFEIQIQKF